MFISNNYRTTNPQFEDDYSVEEAQKIPEKMQELINNYNDNWSSIGIFKREALFNVELIRILPYEDGNGRTSRLLLVYNMLRQGHAPIAMKEETRKEYFEALKRRDINYLKKLFIKESQQEQEMPEVSNQEEKTVAKPKKLPNKKI